MNRALTINYMGMTYQVQGCKTLGFGTGQWKKEQMQAHSLHGTLLPGSLAAFANCLSSLGQLNTEDNVSKSLM